MQLLKIARTYAGIIERCYKENSKAYNNYGGRGIAVCDEWIKEPGKFFEWCNNQGDITGLQLDRVNNDGPYSPQNCKFVEPKINVRNRRNTVFMTAWEETKPMGAWAEDERAAAGMTYATIYNRINDGWTPEDAISKPIKNFVNRPVRETTNKVNKGVHPNDPVYEYDGQKKTLAEWAKDDRAKVSAADMWGRIYRYGWNFEKALITPPAPNSGLLYEGKNVLQWSKDSRCEVGYNTLSKRLKSGMSVEKAMKKKPS